jgi:hypothetical protein
LRVGSSTGPPCVMVMARAVVYSRARGAPSDVLGGAARPYRGGRGGRARRRWRHGSPSPFSHSRRLTCSVPLCYVDRHVVYMARAVTSCGVERGAPSDVLGGAARPRDGRARVSCASELATRLSFSVVPARLCTAGTVASRCVDSCRLVKVRQSCGGRPSRRLRRGGRAQVTQGCDTPVLAGPPFCLRTGVTRRVGLRRGVVSLAAASKCSRGRGLTPVCDRVWFASSDATGVRRRGAPRCVPSRVRLARALSVRRGPARALYNSRCLGAHGGFSAF